MWRTGRSFGDREGGTKASVGCAKVLFRPRPWKEQLRTIHDDEPAESEVKRRGRQARRRVSEEQ